MPVLTIMVAIIVAPIASITAFFAIEVFAGLRPIARPTADTLPGDAVIVIPAHNEERVIAETVSTLCGPGQAGERVLVVADNCTDNTADEARAAGAQVFVRCDPERRGKGYALAAAREYLRSNVPDIVIVMDADCRLDVRSRAALVAAAMATSRPCQAVNLLAPDLSGPPMVQISNFAFMIKNLIRQRGLQRLSGRVHLTGTGMALPWELFDTADLGGSNIVEDLALGLDLASRAKPPLLVEEATVWSPSASTGGTKVQRRRWEGGYLATAVKRAPLIISRSFARRDVGGLLIGLDLCVPPVALLALANAGAFVVALLAALARGPAWPMIFQLTAGCAAFVALACAWLIEGRRFVRLRSIALIPLYVLWKVPLYLGLMRRGAPKDWLRAGR